MILEKQRRHTMKKISLLLLLSVLISSLHANDEDRDFLFSLYSSLPIFDWSGEGEYFRIANGLEFGYALTNRTYLITGVDTTVSREGRDEYRRLYLSGIFFGGVRLYPFSKKLTLSLRTGFESISTFVNGKYNNNPIYKYALGGTIGWDFDRTLTGFSVEPGIGFYYLRFLPFREEETGGAKLIAYIKFLYK